ncbi:hypothetical protein MLD38_017876 [Melastoma candidum]|uniref:Uncharacterized protein n=1 Tax=Melastoma candidum TaxID=119954 RepID=A0ACB9QVL0_9MYRT|nr:hypothetical protein MLD38_017876 [Melastoma candidum]
MESASPTTERFLSISLGNESKSNFVIGKEEEPKKKGHFHLFSCPLAPYPQPGFRTLQKIASFGPFTMGSVDGTDYGAYTYESLEREPYWPSENSRPLLPVLVVSSRLTLPGD